MKILIILRNILALITTIIYPQIILINPFHRKCKSTIKKRKRKKGFISKPLFYFPEKHCNMLLVSCSYVLYKFHASVQKYFTRFIIQTTKPKHVIVFLIVLIFYFSFTLIFYWIG